MYMRMQSSVFRRLFLTVPLVGLLSVIVALFNGLANTLIRLRMRRLGEPLLVVHTGTTVALPRGAMGLSAVCDCGIS